MLKKDLEENNLFLRQEIDFLKQQVLDLKEEKENYRKQVERLQDSLMSVRAPEAYRDMKVDQAGETSSMFEQIPEDLKQKLSLRRDLHERWIENLEQPSFKSADDMIDILSTELLKSGADVTSTSLHDNDES